MFDSNLLAHICHWSDDLHMECDCDMNKSFFYHIKVVAKYQAVTETIVCNLGTNMIGPCGGELAKDK